MINWEYPDGATPLDPDEIEGLLPSNITTQGELDRWEQENILEADDWLARTKPTDILNEAFIRKLHKRMYGNVWAWAGKFRKSDKNIGDPWEQIATNLRNLCDDVITWIGTPSESKDQMAARFHHNLVSIHPFPNGNGRHARLMADLLLKNIFHEQRFTWGSNNLSAEGSTRKSYIAALRAADQYDYEPLFAFVMT